jgi:hypothetical protein
MSISGIEVRLSRLKLMSIDGCDTDVALNAIKDAIETALFERYPESVISVSWQIKGPDLQYDIVGLEWSDKKSHEDGQENAEEDVARLVDSAASAAIGNLFEGPPVRWAAWPQ